MKILNSALRWAWWAKRVFKAGLLVNVNDIATRHVDSESAMQELIEETTRQTEESLTERLEQAEEGFG